MKKPIFKKDTKILIWATSIFSLISFVLLFIKYKLFLYNALDLSIFNNVFYNLVHNHDFYSSIQGHTYLADHFAPLMKIFLPFYAIYNHPLTLVLLQTVILGLTSFVVYKLAKTFFKLKIKKQTSFTKRLPLIVGLLWLINPLVWNINFFEFHIIVLALPLIFAAALFYFQNNYKLFTLFLFLSCLVREDIAIIIFMFGIIAIIDKKPLKCILTPIFLSLVYFTIAIYIINIFSSDGFRFFTYYAWLGETPKQAIINFFINPLIWIKHILRLSNLDMMVGLLFPFIFLPLRKPKYLLLALIPLAQFILNLTSGSNIIVETHYAAFFVPALLLASLDTISYIVNNPKSRWAKIITLDLGISKLIIPIFLILTFFALGPLGKIIINIPNTDFATASKMDKSLPSICNDKNVAASFDLIANYSSRKNIYLTHYMFTGHQQYTEKLYETRTPVDKIIFDQNDFTTYWLKVSAIEGGVDAYHKYFTNWQERTKFFKPSFLNTNIIEYIRQEKAFAWPVLFGKNYGCVLNDYNKNYYEVICTIREPKNAVYFIKAEEKIFPIIWRIEKENHYESFAIFYLEKNNQTELSLDVVKIKGQVELGPWSQGINKIYKQDFIKKINFLSN